MSFENFEFENESTLFCDPKIQRDNPAPPSERSAVNCFETHENFNDRLVSDLTVRELRKIIWQESFHPFHF